MNWNSNVRNWNDRDRTDVRDGRDNNRHDNIGRDNGHDNNRRDNNWRDNNNGHDNNRRDNWRDNNNGHDNNRRDNWRDNNNGHDNIGHDNIGRDNGRDNGRDRNWEMTRWDHGDNAASIVYARQPERRGGKEPDTDDVVVDIHVLGAADNDAVDIVDNVENSRVEGNEKATTEDVDSSTDSSETRLTNHVNETIVSVYMLYSSPSICIVSNTFCSDNSRSYTC
jgi:hypothetical protein